jgi:hypothetical protein
MKKILVLDTEVYKNYFLLMFKGIDSGKVMAFELYDGHPFDSKTVLAILQQFTLVSFNGIPFDMPVITAALRGRDTAEIKQICDDIILRDKKSWDIEREYNLEPFKGFDHIDLKETVPGVMISLKLYGARLHSKRLQDLPIEPDALITPAQRPLLISYCENDLDTTIDLYKVATNPKDNILHTRELLTKEFGLDMRSKSDAQCAEAMIKIRVTEKKGSPISKNYVAPGTSYKFQAPAFIKFKLPMLQAMFAEVLAADFVVQESGQIALPESISKLITINGTSYQMGLGGLHSNEHSKAHVSSDQVLLRDRDVVSYYPSLILKCGLSPTNMGEPFQVVFKDFFDRRIAAKKSGDKSTAQTLKIVLNGSFGKLGSKYSLLYSPNLLIQVTITGQLAMLMLIERMEARGIPVVSANTDGIVMPCPAHLERDMLDVVRQWEIETGLETEETPYRALFSRDVNNYMALKAGGGYKVKGTLVPPGVQKNPDNEVVAEAVCKFLDMGIPIAQTILGCTDIRKFLRVKRVTGGGKFNGQYLGRVVRWYRAVGSTSHIEYVTNGNKVGGSDGAQPLMELDGSFPTDVDYGYYLAEASDLMRDIGAAPALPVIKKTRKKAGEKLRDAGIDAVLKGEWKDSALAALKQWIAVKVASGVREVTMEEFKMDWDCAPHHPNAWGALCRTAALSGLLIPTEKSVRMTNPAAHARFSKVWAI